MTPLQKLYNWLDSKEGDYYVTVDDVMDKIKELLPEEREGYINFFNAGHDLTYNSCESDCGGKQKIDETGEFYFKNIYKKQ